MPRYLHSPVPDPFHSGWLFLLFSCFFSFHLSCFRNIFPMMQRDRSVPLTYMIAAAPLFMKTETVTENRPLSRYYLPERAFLRFSASFQSACCASVSISRPGTSAGFSFPSSATIVKMASLIRILSPPNASHHSTVT